MIGLSTPAVLIIAPVLLGLLIYAYLRKGRGKKKVMPTLFILEKFSTTPSGRSKFIPPPRFFFELLILCLLLGAIGGLWLADKKSKITLLIDNSLSMGAKTVESGIGKTLLESVLNDAEKLLRNLENSSDFEIYQTSPVLSKLTNAYVNAKRAGQALQQIRVAYANDNLLEALEKVLVDSSTSKLIVFSDNKSTQEDLSGRISFRTYTASNLDNISISSVECRSGTADIKPTISVNFSSYAEQDETVKIALSSVNLDGTTELLAQREQIIPAQNIARVDFEQLPAWTRLLKIEFAIVGVNSNASSDSLIQDNVAWLVPEFKSKKIILVSDFSIEDLNLTKLKEFSFKQMSFVDYTKFNAHADDDSPILFHRAVPDVLPERNIAFIYPDDPKFVSEHIEKPALTHWSKQHDLLNYLKVPLLNAKSALILKQPEWAEELVATSVGPVLLAGTDRGLKRVIIGFEIFPYLGKRAPFLSVFSINLLKWISNANLSTPYENLPYSLPRSQFRSASYLGAESHGVENSFFEPGIIKTEQNGEESYVALNFFDGHESNLRESKEIAIKQVPQAQEPVREKSLWIFLTKLALILLALDIIFAFLKLIIPLPKRI